MNRKTVTLPEFLTEAQIIEATLLYEIDGIDATEQILTRVIEPNLTAINEKLGQENNARYLAYMVIIALSRASTDDERLS